MFASLRPPRAAGNRFRNPTVASLIERALFLRVLLVIGGYAPYRLPSLALFSAPEGTTDQMQMPVVAPMGEKENAALPASDQAMLPRHRLGSSHRSQDLIIFQNRGPSFGLSVPFRPELKKLRDPGCKKPKLALRMPTYSIATLGLPDGHRDVQEVGRGFFFPSLPCAAALVELLPAHLPPASLESRILRSTPNRWITLSEHPWVNSGERYGSFSASPTQAEVQALRDKCEELADDVRALSVLVHALRTALVTEGLIKGGA